MRRKHWTVCHLMAEPREDPISGQRQDAQHQQSRTNRQMEQWRAGRVKEEEEREAISGTVRPIWQLLPPPPHPHPLLFLYLSLSNPTLSPALNLWAFNAQNFSDHRPFSPALCASPDKYRTLLAFPNELWHTCTPPNHAWDRMVYKARGWGAAGEWENKWS